MNHDQIIHLHYHGVTYAISLRLLLVALLNGELRKAGK